MTESTDFSTSLKGLSKVTYFTVFYMTVTALLKHFLKLFFSILQVSKDSRENTARSMCCPG